MPTPMLIAQSRKKYRRETKISSWEDNLVLTVLAGICICGTGDGMELLFLHGNSRLGSSEFGMDAPVLEISLEEWGVSVGFMRIAIWWRLVFGAGDVKSFELWLFELKSQLEHGKAGCGTKLIRCWRPIPSLPRKIWLVGRLNAE